MKNNLLQKSLLFYSLSLLPVSAVQYTVQNIGDGTASNGVTDNAGNLLTGATASAAFGFFSSDSAVTNATSATDLLDSDWTIFGDSSGNSEENFNGSFPLKGTFSSSYSFGDISLFDKKNVYLVLGKGNSLASSSEFFVYKFNTTFNKDLINPQLLELDNNSIDKNNILIGSIGVNQGISPSGAPVQPTFQMAFLSPIPEPSSTALLGLGSLALMFRRRR